MSQEDREPLDGQLSLSDFSPRRPKGLQPEIEDDPEPDAEPSGVKSYAELVADKRIEAAQTSERSAIARCLELVAELGGGCEVDELLAQGVKKQTVADACQSDPSDKRNKPRLNLGFDAEGGELVWLTTTGWAASGHPSRRAKPPSSESLKHQRAHRVIADWYTKKAERYGRNLPRIDTRTDPESIREFSKDVESRAWSAIQSPSTVAAPTMGLLTNGLEPDALMIERWTGVHNAEESWCTLWQVEELPDQDLLGETLVALEVELSLKGERPLKNKVNKWENAVALGLVQGVIWVTDDGRIAKNLQSLGIGNPSRKPGQYLTPYAAVGGTQDIFMVPEIGKWWAQRVLSDLK